MHGLKSDVHAHHAQQDCGDGVRAIAFQPAGSPRVFNTVCAQCVESSQHISAIDVLGEGGIDHGSALSTRRGGMSCQPIIDQWQTAIETGDAVVCSQASRLGEVDHVHIGSFSNNSVRRGPMGSSNAAVKSFHA